MISRRTFSLRAIAAFVVGLVGIKLKPAAAALEPDSPVAYSLPFKSLPHCTAIFGNPRAALRVGIRQVEIDAKTSCFYAFVHFKPSATSLPLQMPEVLLDEELRTRADYMRVSQLLRDLILDFRPSLAKMEPKHRAQLKHFYEACYEFGKIYQRTCAVSDMSKTVTICEKWFCYTQPVTVLGKRQPVNAT
jgi:hypothetical protein